MTGSLLEIERLSVSFGGLRVLDDIDLKLAPGDRLGLVGESGSGKSTLGLAILGLLVDTASVSGTIRFAGAALPIGDDRAMSAIRGGRIGFVYQDPMGGFSPIHTVGRHMHHAIAAAEPDISRRAARERAAALLAEVEIRDSAARLDDYPHQFSGGMLQRIMIASALAGNPQLLIADEPTTALDATTQANVLRLLDRIASARGMAVILITHDLGVVGRFCGDLAVLYCGNLVSLTTVARAMANPVHPYTRGLLDARPRLDEKPARLRTIGGVLPRAGAAGGGCAFEPRCALGRGVAICRNERPLLLANRSGDRVACHLAGAESEVAASC
ncbi:ABC transporter ATP-binding protein [Mesorhizobium sp. LHD-90]|uniref:ABC transporter ATP-binding protein n=1 Tax=Mesorhizobium sp. LHD-90 TaxID=3071414 RepID=UPI0027E039DD|nr:ABC transporter ATP-binding protein [Mesorhizobium sp. LHD-90]MDQ6435612.1 ABC transporter ATP-binding protein [Mesorhizobium sp. LHD-90]